MKAIIIIVTFSNYQSRHGYEVSVIKNGKTVFFQDRIGPDPGAAAAVALSLKAAHKAQSIVADKTVMDIVRDAETPAARDQR